MCHVNLACFLVVACLVFTQGFPSPAQAVELMAALFSLLSADIAHSTPRLFYVWRVAFPGTLPNPF